MMNQHSPRLISCRLPSTVWRVRVANSMDWKPTLRICCATILSSGTIFTIPISTVPTSKNLWRQNKVPDLCFGIFVWLKTFRNRITFILYKLIRENCLCVNWTIHNSVFRNPNAIIICAIWSFFFFLAELNNPNEDSLLSLFTYSASSMFWGCVSSLRLALQCSELPFGNSKPVRPCSSVLANSKSL